MPNINKEYINEYLQNIPKLSCSNNALLTYKNFVWKVDFLKNKDKLNTKLKKN